MDDCDPQPNVPRDLYVGDVLEVAFKARRPDGTLFTADDYTAHTGRVDFFAPPKRPDAVPEDRVVDHFVELTTDGTRFSGTIGTDGWATESLPSVRWTARYVLTGTYARTTYLTFILKP